MVKNNPVEADLSVFGKILILSLWLLIATPALAEDDRYVQQFQIGQYTFPVKLPRGFTLEALEISMERPRVLHFSPDESLNDRLFVGSNSGRVYWLDPPYTQANVLVTMDGYPHSVVVTNGKIYVAKTDGVFVANYNRDTTKITETEFKLMVRLPGGRGHNSRTLKLGPDKQLYVSLGITGNCSNEYLDSSYPENDRRGGVFQIVVTDQKARLVPFASGLRNPVGFDWQRSSGEWYATNNGPDHLGYLEPREVFAHLTKGSFHGMPWYQYSGSKFVEDKCAQGPSPRPVSEVSLPAATFPARIAPMDMMFVPPNAKATQLIDDAIVALHGSWATANGSGDGPPSTRREPALSRVRFEAGKVLGVEDLLSGFQLPDGARWARPMGIAMGADGDIYFSSDAGIQGLYRLTYQP